MSLLRQIAGEIASMFAGDGIMTVFAVLFVALASALRFLLLVPPVAIGFSLFAACIALLLARVYLYAHRSRHESADG